MTRSPVQRDPAPRRRPRFLTALLATLAAVGWAPAMAASLQVAPILVELEDGMNAEALWLTNSGEAPIRAQVRVLAWSQAASEDELQPSRDLLASPPILEIAPGERQLVRIVRPDPGPVQAEQAFRLLVDELPSPELEASSGLQFLLQYSIPVFVLPPGVAPRDAAGPDAATDASALSATVTDAGAQAMLTVVNRGNQRVRLSALASVDASGTETMLLPGLVGYVLAGQRMQWPLEVAADALRGHHLKARLNDDRESQTLPLASHP